MSAESVPCWKAEYSFGPALAPKISIAESELLSALVKASCIEMPSFMAATCTFDIPVITTEVSIPDFSSCPSR